MSAECKQFDEIERKIKEFVENEFRALRVEKNQPTAKEWFDNALKKAAKDSLIYIGRHKAFENGSKLQVYFRCFFKEIEECKKIPENYVFNTYTKEDYKKFFVGTNGNSLADDYGLGVWQKFSNMMFKYLYCIQVYDGREYWLPFSEFAKCDCPIDSFIARAIFRKIPDGEDYKALRSLAWDVATSTNRTWNKIKEPEYRDIQNFISDYCKDVKLIDGSRTLYPVEFDILFWEKS